MGRPLAGFQIPPWRTGSDFWESTALSEDVLSDYFDQEEVQQPCVVSSERLEAWSRVMHPPAPSFAAFVPLTYFLTIPPGGGGTTGYVLVGGSTTPSSGVSGGTSVPGLDWD